ncbi:hypothetical protein V1264_005679 [Littorina saxatilis]|uniref:Uncharacterized protein n=1 Tax=Littorina saxatilis TaxID=31220 RepID=A0AAN9G5P9_9CAEN
MYRYQKPHLEMYRYHQPHLEMNRHGYNKSAKSGFLDGWLAPRCLGTSSNDVASAVCVSSYVSQQCPASHRPYCPSAAAQDYSLIWRCTATTSLIWRCTATTSLIWRCTDKTSLFWR